MATIIIVHEHNNFVEDFSFTDRDTALKVFETLRSNVVRYPKSPKVKAWTEGMEALKRAFTPKSEKKTTEKKAAAKTEDVEEYTVPFG